MKAKYSGQPYDESKLNAVLTQAVADCVRKQVECGIEIVTDGEFSKPGFFTYIRERFDGFESRPNQKLVIFQQEISAFPEYYAQYFKEAMMGGAILPIVPVVCTGPVKYKGEARLQTDIANVKAAAKAAGVPDRPRVSAGDRPLGSRHQRVLQERGRILPRARRRTEQGIPGDRRRRASSSRWTIRSCPTSSSSRASTTRRRSAARKSMSRRPIARSRASPPTWCASTPATASTRARGCTKRRSSDIIEYVLKINAGCFSFEAANPRHEHEYHLFEQVKVPDGKVLCPGVITHASNIVEHPELIAERLIRFANLVGRENVMAGADCGFSSQALYKTEVHSTVVWEKFKAMRQGADIATARLWK